MKLDKASLTAIITAAVLAAGGGTAGGAALSRGPVLADIRTMVREELKEQLGHYVTREEAAQHREAERDRVAVQLGGMREELVRLRIAVERLRR